MKIIGYILLLCFFAACVKDIPNPDLQTIPTATHKGIVILNEGAYSNNNAEISFLDFQKNEISNTIFSLANQKKLGDIAQSIVFANGNYYISINNSNKIIILNAITFLEIKSIQNVPYPRYITKVNDSILFVSSLYTKNMYVVNSVKNEWVNTVTTNYLNPEKMITDNEFIWITNWDTACNKIYKINPVTNFIDDEITIAGYAPHEIQVDKNGMLWVLSGNKYKNKNSYISVINPFTKQLIKSFSFTQEQDPFRLIFNNTKDEFYFIQVNYQGQTTNNGLYKMSINDTILPSNPFISAQQNSYFWAVGIDTTTQHIFLSDPKGFTQSSSILEYTNDGQLITTYKAGIGANTFLFN